jgi:DNA helicase-2/ATP-dependent DNA helicase PcrA
MPDLATNPAKAAAEEARKQIEACIDGGRCFLVEAGAGAGKTTSLVDSLKYLVEKQGKQLSRRHQRIACITYTNVATNEIVDRTDAHPLIRASTIHAFCWSLIKDFQPFLRQQIPGLASWAERLEEAGEVGERVVEYELGHPRIDEKSVLLHHNDVLVLAVKLMEHAKFRERWITQYPVLFIDEYQDTDREFASGLLTHFIGQERRPLIGFFGDHWQKIYGTGCGKIEHPHLISIGKGANFRSAPAIVDCLNRMRPELPQQVKDPAAPGTVAVYHTNAWSGTRQTGQHWGSDLPPETAHAFVESTRERLTADGWDFAPDKTKILMLTHRVLAAEQGYNNLERVFPYNDSILKKEDPHIAFFCDIVEPVCVAYAAKRFGEMFSVMDARTPAMQTKTDKAQWTADMVSLLQLRKTGTVGDVLDHLTKTAHPRISDAVERKEHAIEILGEGSDEDEQAAIEQLKRLKTISYSEIVAVNRFINEQTPFATKHGVKGAEFENVLVVFGRGWNQYDFNQFLEWAPDKIPANKHETFERNRNLFYVICSRPKKRLALLFTQRLSDQAMRTLAVWFGHSNIHPANLPGH